MSAALLLAGQAVAGDATNDAPPAPPGQLVDIGGYRLHLWCMGKDSESPAVVLIPGGGDFSFTWGLVQPEVAKFTRACSYDFAFWAWSDPGPMPRTLKQEAYELHTLLHNAGVKGPYVLVGASGGGPLARVFAREYREEFAGMVLVDATDPDTVMGKRVNGQDVDFRVREQSKGRTVPLPVKSLKDSPPGNLTTEEQERMDRYRNNMGTPRTSRPHNLLPPELQKLDIWARFQFNPLVAKTSNPFDGEEFQALYEEGQQEEPPLGDKPLIVLVSGYKSKKGRLVPPADTHPRDQEKLQQKFAQSQWSRNGQYVLVDCGHEIHLYRPGWVVEAIRQVVETARSQTRSTAR